MPDPNWSGRVLKATKVARRCLDVTNDDVKTRSPSGEILHLGRVSRFASRNLIARYMLRSDLSSICVQSYCRTIRSHH